MAKTLEYSSSPPLKTVSVSTIITCCIIAVFASTLLVAGGTVALAFDAWLSALLMLPYVLVAVMTGLTLTYFPARAAEKSGKILFADSPWPAGFRLILSLMLGLGALSLITLALGSFGMLYPGALALAFLPGTLLGIPGVRQLQRQGFAIPKKVTARSAWILLLAAIPLGVMLIMAAFPPGFVWASEGNGYDVLEYHLQLPKEYVASHSTAPVGHNIYSFMPSLMEVLYAAIGALATTRGGSFISGIYACNYLHTLMTCLAGFAILFAPLKLNLVGRIAGCVLILATPWTIVVGTLAYNDGAMLSFGALALVLALADDFKYRGALIGILLGLAMGCKLTAGVMLAVPIGLILLMRFQWWPLIAAIILATLVFAPWAIRAYNTSGNPIFPVAMKTLGSGHLTPELRDQFDRGHAPRADQQSLGGRLFALADQFFFTRHWSPNLLAIGGNITAATPLTIFNFPGQLGLMWPYLLFVAILMWRHREIRLLLLVLVLQIFAWLFLTHLQSRFMLPALPALALILAFGCENRKAENVALFVILIQSTCTLLLPNNEAGLFAGNHENLNSRPYFLGVISREPDALALPDMYLDPSNAGTLDPTGRTYLVGLATPLFFTNPVIYNTPFDQNFLADSLVRGGPSEAIRMLRELNIKYVVISWSEIDRLRRTYGYPESINRDSIEQLTRMGFKQIPTRGSIELYEVSR